MRRIAVLTLSCAALLVVAGLFAGADGQGRPAGLDRLAAAEAPAKKAEAKDAEDPSSKVGEFMRKKLEASQEVLEGLMTDDFKMISSGAKTMETMSHASDWQVVEGPVYKLMSADFRKTCEELADAAKQENIDRSSLAYLRLTMNCISCHSFVRRTMVAEQGNPADALRAVSAR